MKIVKLSSDLYSEWRENLRHPVDDDGNVFEALSRELETASAGIARIANSNRRTHEQAVVVGGRRHEIVAKMTRVGKGTDDFLLELRIDGLRVVEARDIICAKMLEEHGECQLRHQNNVVLRFVRDPDKQRTTFKQSLQVAPRPEHCGCASWGRSHPGTHHHTCKWNKLAPPGERAPEPETSTTPKRLSSLATRKGDGLGSGQPDAVVSVVADHERPRTSKLDAKRTVVEAAPLDPPESCRNDCRKWALPKNGVLEDGQHHPMCVFHDEWKRKTAKSSPRWLVDLGTGEKVRPATDEEIGQADVEKKRSGSPIVQVDSTPFAVLSESELNQAIEEEKSA